MLNDIRKRFLAGAITKPEYIDQMHQVHAQLFDYTAWLGKTDIAAVEITDGRVIMTSRANGVRILCDPDDKRMAPIEILNFMEYEKADSDMILTLVKDGDRVLDVGANMGWYSITLGKRYPKCDIQAFEPIPKTYAYLQKNLALNNVPNVTLNNHGFSNKADTLTFYYYPTGSGNASSAKLADVEGVVEAGDQRARGGGAEVAEEDGPRPRAHHHADQHLADADVAVEWAQVTAGPWLAETLESKPRF